MAYDSLVLRPICALNARLKAVKADLSLERSPPTSLHSRVLSLPRVLLLKGHSVATQKDFDRRVDHLSTPLGELTAASSSSGRSDAHLHQVELNPCQDKRCRERRQPGWLNEFNVSLCGLCVSPWMCLHCPLSDI